MNNVFSTCMYCPFARMQAYVGGTKYCEGVFWMADPDDWDAPLERYFSEYITIGSSRRRSSIFPETPPEWCPMRGESYSARLDETAPAAKKTPWRAVDGAVEVVGLARLMRKIMDDMTEDECDDQGELCRRIEKTLEEVGL